MTPIVYLWLARLCVHWDWIALSPKAPHPWDDLWGRGGIGVATLVMAGGIMWMRRLRPLTVRMLAEEPVLALRRWVLDFYLMAGLTDALAFLGFVYFAVSGREWALFAWGAASYLGHALIYPRQGELSVLSDPPPGE